MKKHQEKYVYDALNIDKADFKEVLDVHKIILSKMQSFKKHSEYIDFIENEIKELTPVQQALLINIFCRHLLRIAELSTAFGFSMGNLELLQKGDKQDESKITPIYA